MGYRLHHQMSINSLTPIGQFRYSRVSNRTLVSTDKRNMLLCRHPGRLAAWREPPLLDLLSELPGSDAHRRVAIALCQPPRQQLHAQYLPAGLTKYVLNHFFKKSPPYHVTQHDVSAPLQRLEEATSRYGDGVESSPCYTCLLYTSPSPRDGLLSRMPSSA